MLELVLAGVYAEKNPVIVGDWSDPAVVRVGEDYYAIRSTVGWYPGLAVMHSRDLVHWQTIGSALTEVDRVSFGSGNKSGGVWGSELIYNPNTAEYQIYSTIFGSVDGKKDRGNFLFCSKSPEGPYRFVTKLELDGIDPGVFIDEDQAVYAVTKFGQLYRLSADGRNVVENMGRMTSTSGKGIGGEGPEIYRKGDYYYFCGTHGGTLPYEYQRIMSYRSPSIRGPWEPDPENPVKYAPHTSKAPIQGPGHGELILTQNDEWYISYHTYELNYPTLARQVCLEPVIWTQDGWWRPKHGKLPPLEFEKPNLPESSIRLNQSDEFAASELGPQWFFHTVPDYSGASWSLSERDGWLALKNYEIPVALAERLQRFVMQRMASKAFSITTRMAFTPSEGEFAGLLLYADKENYIQFGVAQLDGQRSLLARTKAGAFNTNPKKRGPLPGIETVRASKDFAPEEVYLKIEVVDPETARFFYSHDNENWKQLGREIFFGRSGVPDLGWQTRYWTGATFGLFVDRGESIEKSGTAFFDWIRVD